jgi:pimeloyl-ACP methyl ester carboxylesterase
MIIYALLFFCLIFGINDVKSQTIIPYGDNTDAGKFADINDVKIYYEVYGSGEPLLLLHGNGGNIGGMKFQIAYFSKHYQVIAMDCRGRGKSTLGTDSLTYMKMTKDAVLLLDHLNLDSAYIIGRSDGGIIALLMGINYPDKVKKIAAFGANLNPDGLYPGEIDLNKKSRRESEEMLALKDTSQNWYLIQQRFRMMEFQPDISAGDLKKIKAPVLVLSCDRDLILEEHTLYIYRNILNSNLCIFPGETHWITGTNPDLFNTTVAKYFSDTFKGEEIRK